MKRHGARKPGTRRPVGKSAGRRRVPAPAADPNGKDRQRRGAIVVSEPALVAATAKETASLKSSLRDQPAIEAEEAIRRSIEEAEEIELLLDEGEREDPEETEEGGEEEAYFLKAPAQGRPRSHARPAQGIIKSSARHASGRPSSESGAAQAAGRPSEPEEDVEASGSANPAHLFPRNLLTEYPVAVKAQGVFIYDSAGRKYLDACGGAVVCSIGHGVPEVASVMTAQAKRLAFAHSSQFITQETMGFAARIAALAPGDMKKTGRVYLVSGGSEAVETAIKLARQYHVETGHPGKSKVIARWQSYHGSTLGALAVTGNVARRDLYAPMFATMPHIPPCYCFRCPYGLKYPSCDIACVEDLEAAIHQEGPETVSAFIAEPVVGATLGAVPAVEGYWNRAREICTKHNVLLIADEVMTGIGRTGRNFAVDHFRVVPDVIVTGKGLSAGYAPLGAVIARGFIADALRAGRGFFEHGFTYSANPLSAAVGSAVLDYIGRHKLIARAARLGKTLGAKLDALRRHRIVGDVRGLGMMWGIEIVKDRKSREPFPKALKVASRIFQACRDQGLLIYPGTGTREGQDGDHFIIAPPFTISLPELDQLVALLDRALAKVAASLR
jgi:adenosylmethionine-8-amino-7-oxononanoate aminotransferase